MGRFRGRMSDLNSNSPEATVVSVVQRLLTQRSISRAVRPDDDLREAGLSSLDMVSLVLSVEDEFGIMIPENSIQPANFRSVATITSLVAGLLKSS
jgi:acyl carrier protein